jgi:hypothetical protein
LAWGLHTVLTLLVALFIAWQGLARANYLYPVWYGLLSIDRTIDYYGPLNRLRPHFETTSREERARLFTEIARGIHGAPGALENLEYRAADGRPLGRMLTAPELVHLGDVTRLVSALTVFGWTTALAWLISLALLRTSGRTMPPPRALLAPTGGMLIGAALLVLIIGPTRVFYAWHAWAFPAGHQWFFYYEESLMTMLMKAPDIFAPIAAVMLALAIAVFLPLHALTRRLTRRARAG